VALAVVLAVNTWVGYVPTLGAARTLAESLWGSNPAPGPTVIPDAAAPTDTRVTTATSGGIITATVPSTARGVPDRPVRFYLPPGYDAPGNTTRYPVYYLLHGSPGTGGDWVGAGKLAATMDTLIQAKEIPPAIVAVPDLTTGSPSNEESVNYPGSGPQFETFFQDDVVPYTDANLRTLADRGHRVVGGMSSGGLESLTFALHRPETFGATISIMAYGSPVGRDLQKDAATTAAYSPVPLIKAAPFTQPLAVYLAQGDQEAEADNKHIEAALRRRGQPVTLQIFAGDAHNWTMAAAAEPYGLVWAARQLGWS
jgi:enterochelin esterase-like enzyme